MCWQDVPFQKQDWDIFVFKFRPENSCLMSINSDVPELVTQILTGTYWVCSRGSGPLGISYDLGKQLLGQYLTNI